VVVEDLGVWRQTRVKREPNNLVSVLTNKP
jgi:hypothetical protein